MSEIQTKLFDPETSLLNLNPVKWCYRVTIGIALLISIPITWKAIYLPLDLTGEGINRVADLYKVPLGILATGLALIGICGANHRSEQTKRQIERTAKQIELTTKQIGISTDQNNFSNYYKHIEEFDKYRAKLSDSNFKFTEKRGLHLQLYPSARRGDFNTSPQAIVVVESACREIIDLTVNMANESSANWLPDVSELIDSTNRLAEYFYLNGINSGMQYLLRERTVLVPKNGLRAIYEQLLSIIDKINHLLQFDLAYKTPRYLSDLLEIEPSTIPNGVLILNKDLLFTPLRRYDDCDNYSPSIISTNLNSIAAE